MEHLTEIKEAKKNKLIEHLSEQYSQNKISLEEYERLIEYCNKIETDKELILLEKIIEENNIANNENTGIEKINIGKTKKAISILSDVNITINEDDFMNNKITIEVFSVMGSIKINVPEGIKIINNVTPILSDIKIKGNMKTKNNKIIIINGISIMGDIKIITNTNIQNKFISSFFDIFT
jgi:hypothetical protein